MPDTILIVDDTPANLRALADCITTAGYALMVAEDGEEALAQTRHAVPDLVLLDVMMPGLDGFETCRRLKQAPGTRDVPVIFMTALADTAEKIQGFQAGAVDYLTKPIQHEEALARVHTHLMLRQLRRRLESELALKQQFMRIAAHDLRNPVCLILLSAGLASRARTPEELTGELAGIQSSARQIQNIIDTFLNVQKSGTGRVNLALLAEAVVAQHQAAADLKRIVLRLEAGDADLPNAVTEAGHAYQALTNYVSNAIKFLPEGGRIVVRLSLRAGRLRLEVQDDGPGVPAAERPALFTEYARLSVRPTGGEESTGLGLSIVKHLIESQDGCVGADFPDSGGAIFWFELPAATKAPKAIA
ncbi:MAG TPA: hybrid sensor histidine kinase/response regulator [Lacunisphaera sp.]|nr:hybrid sensor histidine kinase/response regulator [Lacunisphaera sp.]